MPVGEQEAYRRLWREEAAGRTAPSPEPNLATPCRHFDEFPVERAGCGSCQAKWVYPCELYGKCSPLGYHAGVKRCQGCVHYVPHGGDAPEPSPRRLILVNSGLPGDVLPLSAAIESLHRTHPGAYIAAVEGAGAELLDYNPHVARAKPLAGGEPVEWERITTAAPAVTPCTPRSVQADCGWLESRLGVPVPPVVARPRVYLTPDERRPHPAIQRATSDRRYVLVATRLAGDAPGSNNSSECQRVLDLLDGRVPVVHVGEATGPLLRGALDLRGPLGLRQLARLAFHAAAAVGSSALLRDLSAAFEKPYVNTASDWAGLEPIGAERAVALLGLGA
jgi:hypothetical protein